MLRDLCNAVKIVPAFLPKAAVTDNTAQVSEWVNLQNFGGAILAFMHGNNADADVTYTLLIEESDASGSGYTAVADADLIGTEVGAAPLLANDNFAFKIGYKGKKQYVRATITPANNTGNVFLGGVWILHGGRTLPHTTQKFASEASL